VGTKQPSAAPLQWSKEKPADLSRWSAGALNTNQRAVPLRREADSNSLGTLVRPSDVWGLPIQVNWRPGRAPCRAAIQCPISSVRLGAL